MKSIPFVPAAATGTACPSMDVALVETLGLSADSDSARRRLADAELAARIALHASMAEHHKHEEPNWRRAAWHAQQQRALEGEGRR